MSDKATITIEVNGQQLEAQPGQMLIEVTDNAGITVPRFCYHKKLSIAANCRMCLVEIENAPKPLPACATPVTDGMKVFTQSPLAREAQKGTMEFLLINHPLDCPICDQGGECELQDVAMGYGSGISRFVEGKRVVPSEDIGPLVATDMTRCIHCTRCVRFGDEIAGLRELGATGRGEHTKIGVYVKHSMSSELSGNIIDLCPVGALTSKPFRYRARAWEMTQHPSIAPHDGVGSNIFLHTRNGELMRVVPRHNEAVNETWISDRDRFSYQALYTEDRLLAPMMRMDGQLQRVDWQVLLQKIAELFNKTSPDRLGALASASSTLEELYLLQKLVRGLGSQNLDHRLYLADDRLDAQGVDLPWLGQSFEELESSQATLLIGSWLRKDQPLLNHRLRKSVLKGGCVMLLNSIDYDFNYEIADKLVVAPSAMVAELAALVKAAGGDSLGLAAEVGEHHQRMVNCLREAEKGTVLLGVHAHMHPDFSLLRQLADNLAEQTGSCLCLAPPGGNSVGAHLVNMLPGEKALSAAAMLEQGLDTCVLLHVEPEKDTADPSKMARLIESAQTVVMATHLTPWMEKHADFVLPVSAFAETSGSFINLQGDVQSFKGSTPPPGEARPAWKVLRVLGTLLDLKNFDYDDSEQVRADALQENNLQKRSNRIQNPLANAERRLQADDWQRVGDLSAYQCDLWVRRALVLQHTPDGWGEGVRINSTTAGKLAVEAGDQLRVTQDGASHDFKVCIDDRVGDNSLWLPQGIDGSEQLGRAYGPVSVEKA